MQVITLSLSDADEIAQELSFAIANQSSVRVAVEDGGFKISVAGGTWSLPYGADTTGRS